MTSGAGPAPKLPKRLDETEAGGQSFLPPVPAPSFPPRLSRPAASPAFAVSGVHAEEQLLKRVAVAPPGELLSPRPLWGAAQRASHPPPS